jgi:glutamate-1-semialdehyde 2,1-aminomutase
MPQRGGQVVTGDESTRWAERLRAVVPWGSSTCSKSPQFLPDEPGVIVRGQGCRVWDADGREFIDYRNALGPITLGYRYPPVDAAIRRQLESGIIFGHPHPLEGEVAEMLCEAIPCAERARFLKTGGEAVAACIKLARYHTGRDHVIQIGYNGWLNSLARGTRIRPRETTVGAPPGIPEALAALHHNCDWNDPDRVARLFDELDGQVAALVVASDYRTPEAGRSFYPFLREITQKHRAVLVFDEIVTGFRIALAGVQEYFGVTPDMAVFAKGIANGMPLSAYVGRAEIMEDLYKATVSSTYGGEALSLAAAKACIGVYRDEPVVEHLRDTGARLRRGLGELFARHGVPLACVGYDACPEFVPAEGGDNELRDRFIRLSYRCGVSFYNCAYPTYSHRAADIDETLERVERGLTEL